MKKTVLALIMVIVLAGITFAQTGVKKKRPLPHEYGAVVISNHSERAGLAPVEFNHWLHRARFTCRLCHVDIGFGMKAGSTGIKAADNIQGYYCGSCHNGKFKYNDKTVFESCLMKYTTEDAKKCERCHSVGKYVVKEYDFKRFTEKLPKERFGNGIDWEKAEKDGLIKLIDTLEGVSIKRPALQVQEDMSIEPKFKGMPEIVFSHSKHTVWNGCELCHPEIFVGIKKGSTKYSMMEIFDGRFCGVCHGKVAFPLLDCQRCHTKPV